MNLLIIDDERTILDTIYAQLVEMNLGMERIDTVSGPEEARRLMEVHTYEIMLCDIVMPREDGISFAKWVLERYPDTKFVFLTAHADISYMKAAISMQSFDYLLQPADRNELRNVVERAAAQVKLERRKSELLQTGSFFSGREEELLDVGAMRYCEGRQEDDAYLMRLIATGTGEEPESLTYLPVYVEILRSQKELEKMEKLLLRSIYQNVTDELIRPLRVWSVIMRKDDADDFLLLLCMRRAEEPEWAAIQEKLENIRIIFKKVLETDIAMYCGEICGADGLQGNCLPLFRAKKDNVRRESRVLRIAQSQSGKGGIGYSFEIQLLFWKKQLEQGELDQFQEGLFNYINGYSRRNMNMEYMVQLHQAVTELILGYMVNHRIDSGRVFDAGMPYLSYMEAWSDFEAFEKAIRYVVERLKDQSKAGGTDVTQEIVRYIRKNLDRDISVSGIAEYVGMNAEYLTKLFKKNTGYALKEYIINEKLEAAKMLLTTTQLPVTLVADHVGYGNYSNFTRAFKQAVGCTPLDYRKTEQNQKMQQDKTEF
ncbi:MAG: response regulator [bacterium]|nr:response regulator [bacterium]